VWDVRGEGEEGKKGSMRLQWSVGGGWTEGKEEKKGGDRPEKARGDEEFSSRRKGKEEVSSTRKLSVQESHAERRACEKHKEKAGVKVLVGTVGGR